MSAIISLYKNAYGGLPRLSWMLALVIFVNRSGTMVTPFLAVYLTEALGLGIAEAGLIISIYGAGAVAGAFIGGWLTDKIGPFRVQFLSFVIGGCLYVVIFYLHNFWMLALGVFILMLVNECFRPANAALIASYVEPKDITRAFSLNRMAINLGFSIGPPIGGLLAAISYEWLFVANGFTCLIAGVLFLFCFRNHKVGNTTRLTNKSNNKVQTQSPFRDRYFLLFSLLCCAFGVVFFQLFSTLPLYYKQVHLLSEENIGLLMGLNGFIVFSMEMVLVYLLGRQIEKRFLISGGTLLLGVSFILLNLFGSVSVLIVSIVFLSLSEMLAMPFIDTVTAERSTAANRGAYMGLLSTSYAVAYIIAPYLGTTIIEIYSFSAFWWTIGILGIVVAAVFFFLLKDLDKKQKTKKAMASYSNT